MIYIGHLGDWLYWNNQCYLNISLRMKLLRSTILILTQIRKLVSASATHRHRTYLCFGWQTVSFYCMWTPARMLGVTQEASQLLCQHTLFSPVVRCSINETIDDHHSLAEYNSGTSCIGHCLDYVTNILSSSFMREALRHGKLRSLPKMQWTWSNLESTILTTITFFFNKY